MGLLVTDGGSRCVVCGCSGLTVCVSQEDTIEALKKLIAAQTATRWDQIVLKKWLRANAEQMSGKHSSRV